MFSTFMMLEILLHKAFLTFRKILRRKGSQVKIFFFTARSNSDLIAYQNDFFAEGIGFNLCSKMKKLVAGKVFSWK